jgi:large subunit ribosomal protein L29
MSKRSEAVAGLRALSDTELAEHLDAQRRKLFEIRFQQITGQVENQRQLRVIRREVARTMTVQKQAADDITADDVVADDGGEA